MYIVFEIERFIQKVKKIIKEFRMRCQINKTVKKLKQSSPEFMDEHFAEMITNFMNKKQ